MLNSLKLRTKFSLFLILVFMGAIAISGFALSTVLRQQAENEVTNQALLLMQTMNSVRSYTSDRIRPLLQDRLQTEPEFIPEVVPAFSATEIFETLRKNEDYKKFFYKEATLNPTNLRDQADGFEAQIVEKFRSNPGRTELSGFRSLPQGDVFYIARPLAIKKAACLQCHSTPEAAPKSQIATYGPDHGFGWKLNEVVAAQVISVPADEVFSNAQRSLSLIMSILLGVFGLILLLINFLLKRIVIRPIRQISHVAEAVSMGKMDANFGKTTDDEIGALAAAFNRMKSSLEIAMRMLKH